MLRPGRHEKEGPGANPGPSQPSQMRFSSVHPSFSIGCTESEACRYCRKGETLFRLLARTRFMFTATVAWKFSISYVKASSCVGFEGM